MYDTLIKRLSGLLTVKSIMTIILTIVFAILALRGEISQDFLTIYAMVVSFFFGYQTTKDNLTRPPDTSEGGAAT